jgi:hypothetical protein
MKWPLEIIEIDGSDCYFYRLQKALEVAADAPQYKRQ